MTNVFLVLLTGFIAGLILSIIIKVFFKKNKINLLVKSLLVIAGFSLAWLIYCCPSNTLIISGFGFLIGLIIIDLAIILTNKINIYNYSKIV
ncbi:MAG: hypothetical protein WC928_01485 [Patescibacteria group bacterium]|jgi:uncharacterized membrane protein